MASFCVGFRVEPKTQEVGADWDKRMGGTRQGETISRPAYYDLATAQHPNSKNKAMGSKSYAGAIPSGNSLARRICDDGRWMQRSNFGCKYFRYSYQKSLIFFKSAQILVMVQFKFSQDLQFT
jgi:hypothetical protein